MKQLAQMGLLAASLAAPKAFAQDADLRAEASAEVDSDAAMKNVQAAENAGPEPIEVGEVVEGLNSFSALTDEVIEGGVGLVFERSTSSQQDAEKAEAEGFYVHETPLPGSLKEYLIYIPLTVSSIEARGEDGKIVLYSSTINNVNIATCDFINATSTEGGYLFEIVDSSSSTSNFTDVDDFYTNYAEEYPVGCISSRDHSWAAAHRHQEAMLAAQQPEPPKERSVILSGELSVGAGSAVDEIGSKYRAWTAATLPLSAGVRLTGESPALSGLGLEIEVAPVYANGENMDGGFGLEHISGSLNKNLRYGDVRWQVAPELTVGHSWDPTTDMLDSDFWGAGLQISREMRPGQSFAFEAGVFSRLIHDDLSFRDNFFQSAAYPGAYAQVAWVMGTKDHFDKHGASVRNHEPEVATDAFIDASKGQPVVRAAELPKLKPAEEAEIIRLREELRRFGKYNKWAGVMRAFTDIKRISEAHLEADDYHWAAQAARVNGSLNLVYEYVCKANDLGNATDAALVSAWRAEFGVNYFEGRFEGQTLVREGGAFAPDVRAALEFVSQMMSLQGYYEGWIPKGTYIIDGALPTAHTVRIPEDGSAE